VNKQITRVAVVGLVLLASLIVATTYWQTWAAAGLADRQDNAIERVAQFTIRRGVIYAADGRTVLARNRARRVGGKTLYFRDYPTRDLFAHVVGYATQVRSRSGLERSQNDFLTGSNENLRTVLDTNLDRLRGATVSGNNLVLTVNARLQRVATEALRGQCGAAVVLEPRTGRLLAMVSAPGYDPNLIERPGGFGQVASSGGPCSPAVRLLNRATNGLYIPGSTFKVVTAAAALDLGRYTIKSTFRDPGYCTEYGRPVYNYSDQGTPAGYGTVNFLQSLQFSINSVFCNVGIALGAQPIIDFSKGLGFYADPPLETPSGERAPSGLYRLYEPERPRDVDPGRFAFGQERLLVTPLQMAMVAAAVANGGIVMRPHVVRRVAAPGGTTVTETRPEALGRAMEPRTAASLVKMMEAAVQSGTGTAAQLPGIRVAGKTGTAETGREGRNTTSFIAFAPVDRPRLAIAVFLENQDGTGGKTAAPIAKTIMQALLGSRSNP